MPGTKASNPSQSSSKSIDPGPARRKSKRGLRSSNACEACKKRKIKCSGVVPCEACVAQKIECMIDQSRDLRRRNAVERIVRKSRPSQDTFEAFLDVVRGDDTEKLKNVLELVKGSSSTEFAAAALKDNLTVRYNISSTPNASSSAGLTETADEGNNFFGSITSSPVTSTISPRDSSPTATEASIQFSDFRQASLYDLNRVTSLDDRLFETKLTDGATIDSANISLRGQSMPAQIGVEVRVLTQLPDSHDDNDTTIRQKHVIKVLRIPVHFIQPLCTIEVSLLCRVYAGFLRAARQHLGDNTVSPEVLLGSDEIVIDLFFRSRRNQESLTASSWASEVVSHVSQLDDYVRLAWIVLLTLLMRWLLFPDEKNYAKVPEMIRPISSQLLVPHQAAIDLCPFPVLRESLIHRLRDWVTALADARCSVNWPGTMEDAVEATTMGAPGHYRISRQFREHAVRAENWTVDEKIYEAFPETRGRIPIISQMSDGIDGDLTMDGGH